MNDVGEVAFLSHIAWESEVWIADDPEHMIHFNGDRFLGPYPDAMLGKAPWHIPQQRTPWHKLRFGARRGDSRIARRLSAR